MATSRTTWYPFNRSRTPSPHVFENNLDRDSDDESDILREAHTESKGAKYEFINGSKSRKRDITDAITKPNFMSRQLSNETKPRHVTGLSQLSETSFMFDQYNEQEDGALEAGYIADRNPGDKTSNQIPDVCISHSPQGNHHGGETKEGNQLKYWNKSWTLEEDDLMEMGGFVDPTIRIDPYLSRSARTSVKGENETVKVCWGKPKKYPRIYHNRSSRESRNDMKSKLNRSMMMQSPLAILAKMAENVKMDPASLLDKYDSLGLSNIMPVRFPCMQCFEKQGTSDESYYSKTSDSYYDNYSYDYVDEDKCKRCGGSIQTMSTFIKMLKGLKHRIESNNLVVHDVYPDGNCLFSAVVDQLRVRGVFSYTIDNLREAAVEYLRQNPMSSDGETHFELFLSEETWDQYLARMSIDGVWGDHMVLSAISNVIHQRIVIFGGRSGAGQTIILPTDMQQPDQAPAEEPKDEGIEEKKEPGDSQTSNKTDEPDIQIFERKGTIFLGHFGESHYVSLRPNDWKEQLLCAGKHQHQQEDEISDCEFDRSALPSKIPVIHLNFLLRQLFQLEFVTSAHSKRVDFIEISRSSKEALEEGIGDTINRLASCFDHIHVSGSYVDTFLPGEPCVHSSPMQDNEVHESELCIYLHIPTDSKVVNSTHEKRKFDLLAEDVEDKNGLIRLVPWRPDKWKGMTKTRDSSEYLQAMDLFHGENRIMAFRMPFPRQTRSWMTRERPACWPDTAVISQIEEEGCHVIPLQYAIEFDEFQQEFCTITDKPMDDTLWAVTFALSERKLTQAISQYQLNAFYLFDLVVRHVLLGDGFPKVVCKHIFFNACEIIKRSTWEMSPATCYLLLMKMLSDSLRKGYVPHYFMAYKNLLYGITNDHLQNFLGKIEFASRRPLEVLYFLLDEHSITSTEIGLLLDCIFEDTPKLLMNQDAMRIVMECYVPACCGLLETNIYFGFYDLASNIIKCLEEDMKDLRLEGPCVKEVIGKGLWSMHVGYKWCLAFYLDIRQGTLLSREVLQGEPSVHITEVFGPEITTCLPDTVVPEMCSVTMGDLNFPNELVKVLKCVGDSRTLAKCLRYYLDTYNDMIPEESRGYRSPLSTATLLLSLYVTLFECYDEIGNIEEFRDLLPRLKEAGDDLGTSVGLKKVEVICKRLGDIDETKAPVRKSTSGFFRIALLS